ncbi:MAG TPA: class I SAM-dependent methyltransferase [Mycobacterium sp.]
METRYSAAYDLRVEEQLKLVDHLGPKWLEFAKSWRRYTPENPWYNHSDGAVYYSILTTLRPKRIIEVGCGFSSAIALDVRDRELKDLELTFIEPHPERLLELLKEGDNKTATIHRSIVQDVAIETFDVLEKDDILFIDSSHISSPGSDVNMVLFEVLPRLKPGVVVHFHDIFFPFEYPDTWLNRTDWLDLGWNELYLLRAFLSYNNVFQVMFFNCLLWREHADIVRRYFPECDKNLPGSLWLRRVA